MSDPFPGKSSGPNLPDPLLGATVGNYRVIAQLGEGAMGKVYMAEHPTIGKQVALKVLHPERAGQRVPLERFANEARIVAKLGHPNIVEVYDFGKLEDGRVYFSMELLSGRSVGETVVRHGAFGSGFAAWVASEVCRALQAAHEKGIVHRDVKADNVVLCHASDAGLRVKLLDFGLAKLHEPAGDSNMTSEGHTVGTPLYIAPEQIEAGHPVDQRADLYSLGVLLYLMLTARLPFHGTSIMATLMKHVTEDPVPPRRLRSSIPQALNDVVLKCLAKKPADRFHNAEALREALLPFVKSAAGLDVAVQSTYVHVVGASDEALIQLSVDDLEQLSNAPPATPGWEPKLKPIPELDAERFAVQAAPPVPLDDENREKQRKALRLGIAAAMASLVAVLVVLGMRSSRSPADAPDPAPPAVSAAAETAPSSSALPDMVTLIIETEPPGAQIWIGDEAEPRGRSPLEMLTPGGRSITVRARARGRAEATREVAPDEDATVTLHLAPAGSPAHPPTPHLPGP